MSDTTVNVTVQFDSPDGTPIADAFVEFRLSGLEVDDGYVAPRTVDALTDANGNVVVALWPNELGVTESVYNVRIMDPQSGRVSKFNATIPNNDCYLHNVAYLPAYEGKSVGELAIDAAVAAVAPAQAAQFGAETAQEAAEAAQAAAEALVIAGAVWGGVTGLLSNQTDLQAALDAKSDVHAHPYASTAQGALADSSSQPGHTHTKAEAGLANVDNTADADKPVSTATSAALAGKSDTTHHHNADYEAIDSTILRESNLAGSGIAATPARSDHTHSYIEEAPIDGSEYVRKDGGWSVSTGGAGGGVWGAITGTLSAQTDLQNALNAKSDTHAHPYASTAQGALADSASQPGHTHTKAETGLANVDNTSDANKPVSTAAQSALNGKATTAQGALADSATQPGDNVSSLTNDAKYTASDATGITGATEITNQVVIGAQAYADLVTKHPTTRYTIVGP